MGVIGVALWLLIGGAAILAWVMADSVTDREDER
jgi:hypothetical protein